MSQHSQAFILPNAETYTPILDRYHQSSSGLFLPGKPEEPKPVIRGVDLFSGCGGFSCGFKQAGFHVAAACEWDYFAMQTYICNLGSPDTRIVPLGDDKRAELDNAIKKGWKDANPHSVIDGCPLVRESDGTYRMPRGGSAWLRYGTPEQVAEPCEVFYFGDIRVLTGEMVHQDLGLQKGDIDVVFGGPPCQGFSIAGKRDVMDPRNSLVFEFGRMIVETWPKTFVMENVMGIANMVTPEGMRVLDALALMVSKSGYSTYNALRRALGSMPTGRAAARGMSNGQDIDEEVTEETEESGIPQQGSLFASVAG
ncbi:MAG: dcm [Chloroflexi bacterium]|nr:dcm [Chloroflexota bacterium]